MALSAKAGYRGKRMIEERPAEIEGRRRVGSWEIDTVMGDSWKKPCIVSRDNGTGLHGHVEIEAATGTTIYSVRPHHPWQRDTNENTNGLIRQYLRKEEKHGEPDPEAVRCDRTQTQYQTEEVL